MNGLAKVVTTTAIVGFVLLQLLTQAQANAPAPPPRTITIGSKSFDESVILGEMAAALAREAGNPVKHKKELGGTQVVWKALLAGDIDVYPEYTGTIKEEILTRQGSATWDDLAGALAKYNVRMTRPLGFSNSYALGMKRKQAESLSIKALSDLAAHQSLRMGFSNEFLRRGEGWPSLRKAYSFPQAEPKGLDHMLAYQALLQNEIEVTDVYTSDAEIQIHDLAVLSDDRNHFPHYDAVFLYRDDLSQHSPRLVQLLEKMDGAISQAAMVQINAKVKQKEQSEAAAAADFLNGRFGMAQQAHDPTLFERLARTTGQHLFLVFCSLAAAILTAVPLGVLAARRPTLGQGILTVAEIVQTIPGLALLVLLMPPLTAIGMRAIGPGPAIVAMFLYSLLPIIRNTYTGMKDIPSQLRESADVLGLTSWARLWYVELPLASRMILAGIKTTAAINVGYATLGGLIGAGGYGEPIMSGLRKSDTWLMLEGAVPAALLALVAKYIFEFAELLFVPRGLRLKAAE